jgi:hypothetical protein
LDEPKLQAKVIAQERAERRRATKNLPLARAAMAYANAVNKWFENASPVFKSKGFELETLARLETGNPEAEAADLAEFVEVIRWYQHFIYVKLSRAIGSRANEELETDEEMKTFPKDSDGSGKIALIAMDRSIAAWSGLRLALSGADDDEILDLLAQLVAIDQRKNWSRRACQSGAESFSALAGDVTFIRASEPEPMPHLVSVLGIVVSKAVGGAWKWRMRCCRICVNTGSSTQRPSGWPDCLLLLF